MKIGKIENKQIFKLKIIFWNPLTFMISKHWGSRKSSHFSKFKFKIKLNLASGYLRKGISFRWLIRFLNVQIQYLEKEFFKLYYQFPRYEFCYCYSVRLHCYYCSICDYYSYYCTFPSCTYRQAIEQWEHYQSFPWKIMFQLLRI